MRDGSIGVDRPYGLADFAEKCLRASARAANRKSWAALDVEHVAFEFRRHDGEINGGGSRIAHSVVVDIADNADNFAPIVDSRDTDALADGVGGRTPVFASEALTHDRHRNLAVDLAPGEGAPSNHRDAQRLEILRTNEVELAKLRSLALASHATLRNDGVLPQVSVHRYGARESDRRDSRKSGKLVANLLFDARNAFIAGDFRTRKFNAKCLCVRLNKARIDVRQGAEGADHQAGADEQDKGERHLERNQKVARTMALAALAQSAAALAKGCSGSRASIFENWNGAEEQAGENRDGEGEKQDVRIDADVIYTRKAGWGEKDEEPNCRVRDSEAQDAADEADGKAFEEQLASEACAAGAKSGADGKFLLASFGAHQKEIGNISAGNE